MRRANIAIAALLVVVTAVACQTSTASSRAARDAAGAPSPSESNTFAIPQSRLLCRRSELPRSAPAGLIGYEFEDGRLTAEERVIRPAYDSAGRPVMLIMTAPEKLANGERAVHVLSTSFPPNQPYSGFRVLHPEIRQDNTIEPLAAAEVAQAHDLAVWLWTHRCTGNVFTPS